ncbi:hypothetical protein EP7_000754 [Isosphaeraceae bacterium EP7]
MRCPCLLPGVVARLLAGLTLALTLASALPDVSAQVVGAKPAPLPPPTFEPLGRYAPAEGVALYFEFGGLLSKREAWTATAAYKVFAETGFGPALEGELTQILRQMPANAKFRQKLEAAELITLARHIADHGVLFAVVPPKAGGDGLDGLNILVLRNAARKDIRPQFARLMGSIQGDRGAKLTVAPGNRSVVMITAKADQPGGDAIWWVEKDDLIVIHGDARSKGLDAALKRCVAIVDGTTPNATTNPAIVDLLTPVDGFQPIGILTADVSAIPPMPGGGRVGDYVQGIDARWGFQDEALLSVTRLKTATPRKGLLTLLDQPTFGRETLPPIPGGTTTFAVLSTTPDKVIDQIMEFAKQFNPNAGQKIEALEADLKEDRIKLREDLLRKIGPRIGVYLTPVAIKPDPAPAAPGAPTAADSPPLASLFRMPKVTLVADVNDSTALARTLDQLMIYVNQRLRDYPVGTQPPPTEANAGGAPAKKKAAPAVMNFRTVLANNSKSFILTIPPGTLPAPLAALIRPAIRLGPKTLVISSAADTARQAVELKPEDQIKAEGDLATPLSRLPGSLIFLAMLDPRPILPQALASSASILNAGIALGRLPDGRASTLVGNHAGLLAVLAGNSPDSSSPGATPVAPGAKPSFRVRADSSKIVNADAIRQLLFPHTFAISADAQQMTITTRQAYPSLLAPSNLALLGSWAGRRMAEAEKDATDAAQAAAATAPATPGGPGFQGGPNGQGRFPGAPGAAAPGGASRRDR